jgi:hypothetical protein
MLTIAIIRRLLIAIAALSLTIILAAEVSFPANAAVFPSLTEHGE